MNKRQVQPFTLIELLVVIAIIAILASLLLPVLGKAREMGKQITCTSNMKQVYTGICFYNNDYDNWMPPPEYTGRHIYLIREYLNLKPDKIMTYACLFRKPSGVVFCPSASPTGPGSPCWSGSGTSNYFLSNYQPAEQGVASPSDGGAWYLYTSTATYPYRRLDAIKPRSVILGDMNWAYTSVGYDTYRCDFMLASSTAYLNKPTSPGWNHRKNANFLFRDGHVSAYKFNGRQLFDGDWTPRM